jgi:hypothetical protein
MSTVNNGPQIVKNGLVLNLDASARRSYLPNSYINMNNWTVSNGSVTDYNQNGSTIENQRTLTTNPWGNNDIIWGSYPSGDGEADGGWSTSGINIDKSKLYRFSVWMKRTSSTTGGTAYLGGTAWDATQYLKRTVDGVDEPNPYWYYSNISSFTQNVWYLVVGHLYPYNTTYTGRHPDSGLYNAGSAVKVADIGGNTVGGDFKFSSTSTYAYHRVFHYYCGDNTSRLQFYDPRVDLVDGKEPSINELVNYSPAQWRDLSGNGNNGVLTNKPTYDTNNKGNFSFNGVDDLVLITNNATLRPSTELTIEYVIKGSTPAGWNPIIGYGNGDYTNGNYLCWVETGGALNSLCRINNSGTVTEYRQYSGIGISSTALKCMSFTMRIGDSIRSYYNGVDTNTPTVLPSGGSFYYGGTTSAYQISGAGGAWLNGNIYYMRLYNRALTATEVMKNYEATKTRFGL